MRIALVTSPWPLSGSPVAGKPIYDTALRLREYAELEAFCSIPRYPPVAYLRPSRYAYHEANTDYSPAGVPTRYLKYWTIPGIGRFWSGRAAERTLGPALRSWRPDVILAYWIYPTAWAAVRIARRLRVPVVVGTRGSDLNRIPDRLVRSMASWTVRNADAVVAVTGQLRQAAIELGADPARSHSIPNGCDAAVYRPIPVREARAALGLTHNGRLAVQVGNLITSKGVFDLFEAFSRLSRDWPDLRLAFVGDGPAGKQLSDLARNGGLSDRLLLPGACLPAEVALWLNAADVVCLASHAEGCPNVVLEALSCGRPVVASEVGGIPDILLPGSGVLTPPSDPAGLTEGLRKALTRDWTQNGFPAGVRRTWEDVARETFAVCEFAGRK